MSPAALGIAEHLGWAWFVTVAMKGGEPLLLDGRRDELVGPGFPCMPFHHDTDGMELDAADRLLARVKESADACAFAALQGLQEELTPHHRIVALAIRHPPLPSLPNSVADSRRSHHINSRADGMLYHQAICAAADRLNMVVVFHKRGDQEAAAARALGIEAEALQGKLAALGTTASNWTKEHRHAAAAAIAVLFGRTG